VSKNRVSNGDRKFFLRHPDRRHRLRRPLPGERCCSWVVVKKLTASVRFRAFFNGPDPADLGEATAFELWCSIEAPMDDATFRGLAQDIARQFGDRCSGCGRPAASGDLTLVGFDRGGRPVRAGRCCSHLIARIAGYEVSVAAAEAPTEWLDRIETVGPGPVQ
jgi:hypothetical protein